MEGRNTVDGDQYLTTKEAAQVLRVPVRTLQHWAKTGQVPAYRLGGGHHLRFRRKDLDAALQPVQPSA